MAPKATVTVTTLGSRRLYSRRDLQAGQTTDIEASCVDAAVILGYINAPAGWAPRGVRPRDMTEEEPPKRRRGRPRKEPKAEDPLEEKTVPELREMAEEKGVDLPSGYVKKDELVDLVTAADDDDESMT